MLVVVVGLQSIFMSELRVRISVNDLISVAKACCSEPPEIRLVQSAAWVERCILEEIFLHDTLVRIRAGSLKELGSLD